MSKYEHGERDSSRGRPALPSAEKAMWSRVMDFFMFLDAPDRVWAREYVLAWRGGASELSQDLAALVRAVAGLQGVPFKAFGEGPSPDGSCTLANQLCSLMIPVVREGNITAGVYLDRMTAVDGYAPFPSPAIPTIEDGMTCSRGRFAIDSETGEVVSLASTSIAPSLFPSDSMTSMFHWRSQGGFTVFTNSYLVDDLLPKLPSSLRAIDLARATLQSSVATFLRRRCALCDQMPQGYFPCTCISLAGLQPRRTSDGEVATAGETRPDASQEADRRHLNRSRAIEETLSGRFEGQLQTLLRPQPVAPMVALARPAMNMRASFLDDPPGHALAAQMQMLSIRSVVQSATALAQRPATSYFRGVNCAERVQNVRPQSRHNRGEAACPTGATGGAVKADFAGGGVSPQTGDWDVCVPPPPVPGRESEQFLDFVATCGAHDPVSSFTFEPPVSVPKRKTAAPEAPDEQCPGETGVQSRSAEEILEERRQRNRRTARVSSLKRKKNMELLERSVRLIRVVRLNLEARKAALEAENCRLRRLIGD